MKILIVDNSAMNQKGDSYCTNSLNGLFIEDLISNGNTIGYFQFAKSVKDSISTYDLKKNGVMCYPVTIKKNKFLNYISAYFRIITLILQNDFIYFYYPSSFKYAPIICWLFRKKFGLYVRGMNGINDNISFWNYKRAFTIFTVSDLFTQKINKITNRSVANTVRPMIPFTNKDLILNRTYKIKEKVKILFLGRIASDKGIAELLKAAKILKDKGLNFQLNLVGNGEFLQKAVQIIEDYKLKDVVFIRGAVFKPEEVKSYYINADLYILPTYHEGFPRTLYEAMIFGTPIITTFVGGISSLMKDGVNCLEIKSKSVHSIVEKVEFATNNYDKMKEFAKNGSSTVLNIVDISRLTHAQHLNKNLKNK